MDCPVCREPMVIVEYDEVEIDHCVTCYGVWLDAGELELLFGDADACRAIVGAAASDAGAPASSVSEAPRRCPVCRKTMVKQATRSGEAVVYDRCPEGDGLWFDEGELGAILEQGGVLGEEGQIAEFLQAVFKGKE